MLFNSYEFIFIYFPVVFFCFFWIARYSHKFAALWLGAASLAFYSVWNPKFVTLLLGSVCFNYGAGYLIGHKKNPVSTKTLLISAVTVNLGLLGYFKYANFFISTINGLTGAGISFKDIVLPLGISFFTFTQIAFLVDVFRREANEYSFIHYLLFVTYFPHLIAGPILHHKQIMPQFSRPSTYYKNIDDVAIGLSIFTIGLTKKILLADHFGTYATPIFSAAQQGIEPTTTIAWIGALAYTFQLYFDFSGYSDMAIGLSRMFGIRLPINFNSPYKASSVIEFWQCWHITLSQFLKDYLYIPLGGNRHGNIRRYTNLMITMLLGGLWHGANWTFVFWGGLHGLYLILNHAWRTIIKKLGFTIEVSRWWSIVGTFITFISVVVGWVFFRSPNFHTSSIMLTSMAGFATPGSQVEIDTVRFWQLFGIGAFVVWLMPPTHLIFSFPQHSFFSRVTKPKLTYISGAVLGLLFGVCVLRMHHVSEFLYFQF